MKTKESTSRCIEIRGAYYARLYCPFCGKGHNGGVNRDGDNTPPKPCAHMLIVKFDEWVSHVGKRLIDRALEHDLVYEHDGDELLVAAKAKAKAKNYDDDEEDDDDDEDFEPHMTVRQVCETFRDVVIFDQIEGAPGDTVVMTAFAPKI